MLRQGAEYSSQPNAVDTGIQVLEQQVRDGTISLAEVQSLVRMRTIINGRTPPVIWSERDVSLEGRAGLAPVVVAIWDSGVDVSLFPGRLFVNSRETPGNSRDDDGNGYVDDVHGIAYDLKHDRTTGVLGPISRSAEERTEYVQQMSCLEASHDGRRLAPRDHRGLRRKANWRGQDDSDPESESLGRTRDGLNPLGPPGKFRSLGTAVIRCAER
jgi:hypothetical protein